MRPMFSAAQNLSAGRIVQPLIVTDRRIFAAGNYVTFSNLIADQLEASRDHPANP